MCQVFVGGDTRYIKLEESYDTDKTCKHSFRDLKLAARRNGKLSHKTIWRQFIKSVEKCWRLILNPD